MTDKIEAAAKLIYETWKDIPEYRLWQNGGNSLKQDEARRIARQVIELARQQEVAAPVGDDVETMAASRYHIDKTEGGFWPYVVRCGNGTQVLHKGHLTSCQRLAQQLKTAFLDGAFVANKGVKADAALDATIKQRDRGHRFADEMAAQIAAITGSDIGEHSSSNCPWQQAVRAADDFLASARVPVASPAEQMAGEVNAQTVIDRLNDTLNTIGNFAHDRSKGPAEQDDLWEVRRMAYEGQIEFDATSPVGAGGAMPELPEAKFPHNIGTPLYSADQMREYARAAIQQAAGAVPEGAMNYALDILVAAGHITREKAFQTRDITRQFYSGSSGHLDACDGGGVMLPTPPAQRWQVGTWTLTAPDGRTWQADSPLKACSAEQRDRIPPEVALKRIFDALDKGE